MSVRSDHLANAKKGKNDEFYTHIDTIKREISAYYAYFKGKTVYCNCDNPEWSQFWAYFSLNFDNLGLKRLISTHYDAQQPIYRLDRTGMTDADVTRTELTGNGDFRSPECTAILNEADVVVTNPPFSLFREYIAHLVAHDKTFLIIGNVNGVTCKEVFPLIQQNKLWFGISKTGLAEFRVPVSYPLLTNSGRIDELGVKYIKVAGTRWFTNIPLPYPKPYLDTHGMYVGNEENYPMYDNYPAIDVSKVVNIPSDYKGEMGVPITFLDTYNTEQFRVVGLDAYLQGNTTPGKRFTVKGKTKYARIVIQAI